MAGRDDEARAAAVRDAARAHGFGEGAMGVLWDALVRGGGRQAQFSHTELGGMGQWSGGMLQIGDMFNARLKASVMAACADLAVAVGGRDAGHATAVPRTSGGRLSDDWWPGELGRPAASGAQNGQRYAYFPDRRRLAVAQDGAVALYDTGRHRIFGVSQSQSRGRDLVFTGEDGAVDLASLARVDA